MSLLSFILLANIFVVGMSTANPLSLTKIDSIEVSQEPYIVGGFNTTIEENPWQVSLLRNSRIICGGTIVGKSWVLTAAHCTRRNSSPRRYSVIVGSTFRYNGLSVALKSIFVHKDYNAGAHDYDFALLELEKPLKFNKAIQAITLPNANTTVADGTVALVSGWGSTDLNLKAALVPIVNQTVCSKQYNGSGTITDRMICAGYEEGGIDSCYGDSGGPLTFDNAGVRELIGIVSFGVGCAQPNFPGVYSRVTSVRQWIQSLTGI